MRVVDASVGVARHLALRDREIAGVAGEHGLRAALEVKHISEGGKERMLKTSRIR
jgi:hypothetical protein